MQIIYSEPIKSREKAIYSLTNMFHSMFIKNKNILFHNCNAVIKPFKDSTSSSSDFLDSSFFFLPYPGTHLRSRVPFGCNVSSFLQSGAAP